MNNSFELVGYQSIDEIYDRFGNNLKLDLGCGFNKRTDCVGLDNLIAENFWSLDQKASASSPDIILDLASEEIPLKNSSVAHVYTSHFLEHCTNFDHLFGEVNRVLVTGGGFTIVVPYASSAEGMYPGHNIFLTEKWFKENPIFNSYFEVSSETFDASDYWEALPWYIKKIIGFNFARVHLYNACNQMKLECVKKS